jgi:hypothetical protein
MPKPRGDEAYPKDLLALLALFQRDIQATTQELEQGRIDSADWEMRLARLLMRYISASVLLGLGERALDEQANQAVLNAMRTQVTDYLHPFAQEIAQSPEFKTAWYQRASMYGESIIAPYWQASTRFLRLPAYPADLSAECGQSDRCRWWLDWIDEARLDCDAYWMGEKDSRICPTCLDRSERWSPLKVRNGEWLNA